MHPSSEEGAVLRAEHLTKHYGPVVALDDLNLSIAAGEVVGLLGPKVPARPPRSTWPSGC
jgi:ABC-type sugar transport system ATPase subunit